MISMGVLLGYALQFFVAIQIMWPGVSKRLGSFKHPVWSQIVFRLFMVFLTCKIVSLNSIHEIIFLFFFSSCNCRNCTKSWNIYIANWSVMFNCLSFSLSTTITAGWFMGKLGRCQTMDSCKKYWNISCSTFWIWNWKFRVNSIYNKRVWKRILIFYP